MTERRCGYIVGQVVPFDPPAGLHEVALHRLGGFRGSALYDVVILGGLRRVASLGLCDRHHHDRLFAGGEPE
jgi:hypothetical protein